MGVLMHCEASGESSAGNGRGIRRWCTNVAVGAQACSFLAMCFVPYLPCRMIGCGPRAQQMARCSSGSLREIYLHSGSSM
jgi:hypothetical protein